MDMNFWDGFVFGVLISMVVAIAAARAWTAGFRFAQQLSSHGVEPHEFELKPWIARRDGTTGV